MLFARRIPGKYGVKTGVFATLTRTICTLSNAQFMSQAIWAAYIDFESGVGGS
jgi:hypothetical protein